MEQTNYSAFSLEVFPPKNPQDCHFQAMLAQLQTITLTEISVTLGTNGDITGDKTVVVANHIQNTLKIPAVVHIPGIYQTEESLHALLDKLAHNGIARVLALRGDCQPNHQPTGVFPHADDLVKAIATDGRFTIAGACYPRVHHESADAVADTHYLKFKVDAGVDRLITQMFFDNNDFYRFQERLALADITVPVHAGIMPCTKKSQIERIAKLTGTPLPDKFLRILNRYEHQPAAMRDAGIAYAVDQIVDLVSQGVAGIHLYTLNDAEAAVRIWEATQQLFKIANH